MFHDALDIEPGETVTREPFIWIDLGLRRA
jgi:hypothetical protein